MRRDSALPDEIRGRGAPRALNNRILYYALVEYQAEKKWLVVGLFFGAWILRVVFIFNGGMGMLMGHGPLAK